MGSPNIISIQVTDAVAPTIAPNLQRIATAARDGESALGGLKGALDKLNAGNITALGQQLRSVSTATTQLNTTTTRFGTTADAVSKQVISLATSYRALDLAVSKVIGTLQAFAGAAGTARLAGISFAQSTSQGGRAALESAAGAQAGANALRVLEGSAMGAARAGGQLLATIPGVGAALKFAFPVIGAIALVEILSQIVGSINKVRDAYKEMGAAAVKAEFDAIRAGEKVVTAKAEAGFLSAEGVARLLHGVGPSNDDIQVKNASAVLRDLADQRRILEAQSRSKEAGLSGEELAKQRVADLRTQLDLIKKQKAAVDDLANSLEKQGAATKNPSSAGAAFLIGASHGAASNIGPVAELTETQRKAVAQQFSTAIQASKDLDAETKILGFDIQAALKKEPAAQLKDEIKAAREQMILFRNELSALKSQPGKLVSPQDQLSLLQKQFNSALPENQASIATQIGAVSQQIERQTLFVDTLTERFRDQATSVGEYSDAMRIKTELDKVDLDAQRQHIALSQSERDVLKELITYTVSHKDYQNELKRIYTEFNQPLRTYEAGLQAIGQLEHDGQITHEQALIAANGLNRSYQDAINPLTEYSHGLESQIALLNRYGIQLNVLTEVQQVQEQLRQKGRTLTQQETNDLTKFLTQLQQQKIIQQDINRLYEQSAGQLEKLTLQTAALLRARQQGIITDERYAVEIAKVKTSIAEVNLELGKGTAKDVLTATLGSYIKDFQGFTKETTKLYGDVFRTIADGAADSLGRALAFGEDLGAALKNVAREALAELISGFIKLGIQMLVTAIIGKTAGSAAVASTVAEAASVAAAWAPGAALASLATLGSNAAPADAALVSSVALSEALAQLANVGVAHFQYGGIVGGSGSTDSVPAILTPGEGVLTRNAVHTLGIETITALNRGARNIQSTASSSGGRPLAVNVYHDGTTGVQVEQIGPDEVRIIARQEANRAVEGQAPKVVAQDLGNPNSHTSKAITRNFTARRNR